MLAVGALLAVVLVARARPFRALVRGGSMEPALRDGDVVLALAGANAVTGDVVVVEHPGRPGYEMVKRVVAAPGDAVPATAGADQPSREIVLGPDEWFVVGDARDASTDSRSFGPVGGEHLRGVVRFVVWPGARIGRVSRPA